MQAAQAARAVGQGEGIDDAAEAVVRPLPEIGVDVLVDDRRVVLHAAAGGPDQRVESGQRGKGPGQRGIAAVDVHQPGVVGELDGGGVGQRVAGPEDHLDRLPRGGQALLDVVAGADHLAYEVDLVVARDGHLVAILGLEVLALLGQLRLPEERMAEGMAGDLDLVVGEDAPGDRLQFPGQVRVHALRPDLAFDHRDRGEERIGLDEVLQHLLAGIGTAGHLGTGDEAVAIDVHGGDAPAILGGRVGTRQRHKTQGLAQEGERIEDPAPVLATLLQHIGRQGEAPPVGGRHRHVLLAVALELERRGHPRRIEYGERRQVADPDHQRRFEGAQQRLVVGLGARLDLEFLRQSANTQALQQAVVLCGQAGEERHRHLFVETCSDPVVEGVAGQRRSTGHPGDYPGVETAQRTFGQRLVGGQVVDPITEVFEQAAEVDVTGAQGQVALARIVEQRDASRLHLDVAHPQVVQRRGADERHVAFATQARSERARLVTPLRRQVVDGDDGHALGAQGIQVALQPIAILLGHLAVLPGSGVPTGMDRLHGHRRRDAGQLRQHFETAIEKQLEARLLAMQLGEETGQRPALALAALLGL